MAKNDVKNGEIMTALTHHTIYADGRRIFQLANQVGVNFKVRVI